MVHHSSARLDASFAALSDATRRGVLEQLGRADASITELADRFHMTLTGMKKHVGVLEQAGLVTTEKIGRVRTCKLGGHLLLEETAWLERYRQLWASRFDELDEIIEEMKRKEKNVKNQTTVERKSEREFSVTRSFNGPARIVFEAWTKPEILKRWWTPKSMGMSLVTCEVDIRAGGAYRFGIAMADGKMMTFFGKYIEVTPPSRLVWSNEEAGGEPSITTVTFEEKDGKTVVVFSELHPTKEACDEAIGAGEFMRETFAQLDDVLAEA